MGRLQAWWFARQGLDEIQDGSPAEVARRFGWLRSVGSANPYLAIYARRGLARAEIERAVADVELVEVPAARGCTYYVPREDAGIALRLASKGGCLAEFRMAERHLDVTDEEIRTLADAIARTLEEGPLDPRSIAARVTPRQLGESGKKRGLTSTLSLGLSRLQVEGRIRRLPKGGRMDTERFQYTLWHGGACPAVLDEVTVAREMAARFFRWIGPATEAQFRDFTGLSAKLAREATAGLVSCPDDARLRMRPEDVDAFAGTRPIEGRAVLLASLDPWLHLRRDLPSLLDPSDLERALPHGRRLTGAGTLHDLDSHPIVMDGTLVGLWELTPTPGTSPLGVGTPAMPSRAPSRERALGSRGNWAISGRSASTVRLLAARGSNSYVRSPPKEVRWEATHEPCAQPPSLTFMRNVAVPSLLLVASFAPACCGVGAGGASVVFTGQTNLVVWDAAHKIEHFVRDAHFDTKGGSLGFIAPTPGKPTLAAVDPAVFKALEALKPAPPALFPNKDDKEATASASIVQVVEVKDVGGYHATVLKATDGAALAGWLKSNGYPSPAFLPKWAAPYVSRGWYLTAFRVNGETTGPIRMSFATDRPFNPYAVPEENRSSGATLRLFYVSAGNEIPKIGGTDAWRDAEWTADLPASTVERVAHDLRLEPGAIPAGARVAEYRDPNFGRPGLDDLYFVPDRTPLIKAGGMGVGLAVVAFVLARRRRHA